MIIIDLDRLCDFLNNIISNNYALVCIGTYIRSDDRIALELCSKISKTNMAIPIVFCEYGLENCVHEIKEKKLKKIAVLDAAIVDNYFDGLIVLELDEAKDKVVLSSHSIPIEKTLEYLYKELDGLDIIVIGIPVKNLGLGLDMSFELIRLLNRVEKCFDKW